MASKKTPRKTRPRNGMFTAGLPRKKAKAPEKPPKDQWKIIRKPLDGTPMERTCRLEKVAYHLYDEQVRVADLEGGEEVELLRRGPKGGYEIVTFSYRPPRSPIKTDKRFRSELNGQVRLDMFCATFRTALDRFQTSLTTYVGPSPTAQSDDVWYQRFLDFCKTLPQ